MKSSAKPWIKASRSLESLSRSLLLLFIGAYRTIGTTHLGGACRFTPSCSEYAAEVAKTHRPWQAAKLITQRLLKCRPFGSYGYDPAPTASGGSHATTK